MNTDKRDEFLTLGTFHLDNLEFGVDILQQREVLRMMPVTKMPCSVGFIEGVINLRGEIIPIINLRARFGMPRKDFDRQTRILNIEVTGSLVVGFIVDCVGHVRRMPITLIEPPPAVIASVDSDYVSGVGKVDESLLIILDIPKILSDEDIENLGAMA